MTHPPTPVSSPLDDERVRRDLSGLTVGGGMHMVSGQFAAAFVNFVALVVLARILTPRDYGLVALVLVVTGFTTLLSNAGLPLMTVQHERLSEIQLTNLTWISGAIGALLTVLVLLLSRPLAQLYDEPLVAGIAIALSFTTLLRGLNVQQAALLQRQMRFKALAVIEVGAALGAAVTGIAAALFGAAYWALVVRELTHGSIRMLGVWAASGWRPGLPRSPRGTVELVRVGGTFGLYGVQGYLLHNLDRFLIGKYLQAADLGLYTRAFHLVTLPSRLLHVPASFVIIPALSRVQSEPARFRRLFSGALQALSWATVPIAALILVLADELAITILGPQWAPAGALLHILALVLVVNPILDTAGWLFTALGRASQMLRWGLFSLPVFAAAFVIGLGWGAAGVATGFVVAALATRIPGLLYACRDSPVGIADIAAACHRPYALGVLACAVMLVLGAVSDGLPAPVRLAVAGSGGFLAYGLGALAWPAARAEARALIGQVVGVLRDRSGRREGGATT